MLNHSTLLGSRHAVRSIMNRPYCPPCYIDDKRSRPGVSALRKYKTLCAWVYCTLCTLCVCVYSVYSLGTHQKTLLAEKKGVVNRSFDSSPAKKTQKNDEKKVSKLILWRDSVMQFCSSFCSLFKYLFTSYAVDKAILNPFSILQRLQKKTLQIHWYSIRFSFIFKELSLYQKEALLRNCCRRFFMIKKNSLEYWSFIVKLQWLNSVYGHAQGLTIYLLVILDFLKTAEL